MGFSKFLRNGYDNASFTPHPVNTPAVPLRDFTPELNAASKVPQADATDFQDPEACIGATVSEAHVDTNVLEEYVDASTVLGASAVPFGTLASSKKRKSKATDSSVLPSKKIKEKHVDLPSPKESITNMVQNVLPNSSVRSIRLVNGGKPLSTSSGPGKGKGPLVLKRLDKENAAAIAKAKKDVGGFLGDGVSVTVPECDIGEGKEGEDTGNDIDASVHAEDLPSFDDTEGIFIPQFPRVKHKSDLEDDEDKIDYVRNVTVPSKMMAVERLAHGEFVDFANTSLINIMSSLVTAFDDLCDELRSKEQELEDVQEKLKQLPILVADRDGWKSKFEKAKVQSERLIMDAKSGRAKAIHFAKDNKRLQEKAARATLEKEALVKGLPILFRKFLKSDEFNHELSIVLTHAMNEGGHRALHHLHGHIPGVDVTQLMGYDPSAFKALLDAAARMEDLDFRFVSALASSSHLSVQELLEMEPEVIPEDA